LIVIRHVYVVTAQADGRYEDSMKQARRVLKEVEQWSDRDIRNRHEMMGNLHSQLGNAYLETGKYSRALDHHNKDYELANKQYVCDLFL
jgi:tetratricopeptide repeat protein 25